MTQWLLILLTFNASGQTSGMTSVPFHSEAACIKAKTVVEGSQELRQKRLGTHDNSTVICVEG
jgi:hypothetical protein